MSDPFENLASSLTAPATSAFAVVPDDDDILPSVPRAFWIGASGNVTFLMKDDDEPVTLLNVPDATLLPCRAVKVMATGTTATGIVGLL
ncbi:spike base protein, RCAP_Rcc01079 family [Aquibium microcysteis]|uniref:spike base protein, RCAP_Rcc01079 family n=1 Tax=Aquibium microcysteis TaxID=675281 RepID=UPI00165D2930|nr:hypothetical protein [Aquibium microcysteis]